MKLGAFENSFESAGECRLEFLKRLFGVGSVQPIIRDENEFVQVEMHAGIFFSEPAGLQGRFQDRCDMLRWSERRWSLPVIQHARTAVACIDTEVCFVRNKKNAGSVLHVAVIVDVDQQVCGKTLLLDPAVKDGNKVLQRDGCEFSGEKLDPNSMQFHYGFPTALPF